MDLLTFSPVPDLEILYEVNLNIQVWLTIILACGIFPERMAWEVLCRSNDISPSLLAISVLTDKEIIYK